MRVIDAFAGIGGFSLAADALGWSTVAFVERDPDCQFWLSTHWPGVPIYDDVTTVRWEDAPPCDVFTAGFPCQPHSVAGKRQASADDRDLWSECVRAVRVLRPRYAVFENVSGLLTSESGRFFNRVLHDLAALGYDARWDVLSAAECGAPHKRERVWIVAYPASERSGGRAESSGGRGMLDSSPRVGDPPSGGRGTREGVAVRRAGRGRDGVGHADSGRGEQDSIPAQSRPTGHQQRSMVSRPNEEPEGQEVSAWHLRNPWADAIPYRGADGTVRLIPAAAVADGGDAEPSRAGGESRPEEAEQPSRANGDAVRRGQEEVAGAEPEVRALVDGLSDVVAGRRPAEEEAEIRSNDPEEEPTPWPTVTVGDSASTCNQTATRHRIPPTGIHAGTTLTDAVRLHAGSGGSLWPVTENSPGRVARLRAIGNAVVPAWVLAGPFRYILDREAALARSEAA